MRRAPPREASSRIATVALLSLALGCSLTRVDVDRCELASECRAAFGFGSRCNPEGTCEPAPLEPRCERTWPADLYEHPANHTERLVIATVVDTSLATHVARANAVELAVQDATTSGGVDGRPFGLIVCSIAQDPRFDTRSRAEASLAVVRHLERNLDVPIIIGPPGSGEVQAAFEASERVVFISPSATSPTLTALEPIPASDERPGRLWRTAPTDVEQADQIAADLGARGIDRVALIAQRGAYGDGLVALLSERLDGLQIARFETAGQLSSAVSAVAAGDAEEVLFVSSATADAVSFANAVADDGAFMTRSFFFTDAAANEDLLRGLPASIRARVRGTRPALDTALAVEFERRYRVTYGDSNVDALSFTAHAYDAGWLALYALAWAVFQEPTIDAGAIGRGLRRLSSGPDIAAQEPTWADAIAHLREGRSIDVRGASGALDYDPDTEERSEAGMSFEVWLVSSDGNTFCRRDEACP